MSGHSKWATIKRKKGLKDAGRGKIFTKLCRDITMAAQQGGADVQTNFTLRLVVDRAKAANMPSDTINKLIQKATGQLKGDKMVNVTYEAYGPGGSMILIDCQTDNTNRSVTEVRNALNLAGGELANEGSLSWQFNVVGIVTVAPLREKPDTPFGKDTEYEAVPVEELELQVMEMNGVLDIERDEDDNLQIITDKDQLANISTSLMRDKYKVLEAIHVKMAENLVVLSSEDRESYEKLYDALDELDDVERVWSNVNTDI